MIPINQLYLNEDKTIRDNILAEQVLPYFQPSAPSLQEPVMSKIVEYPEVIRSINDSPTNDYVLVSFLKKNENDVCYVKIRGTGSKEECIEQAKYITQNIDSKFQIAIGQQGKWLYATNEPDKVSSDVVKLIDDKFVTHNEAVNILVKESSQKTKNIKDKQNLEERACNLDKVECDNIRDYINNKIKLYDTNKQISYVEEKLKMLLKKRDLQIQYNNLTNQNDYEAKYYPEYVKYLKDIGVTTFIKKEELDVPEVSTDLTLDEVTEKLNETNYELNNLHNIFKI
jgi:hypothetical protein